MFNQVHFQTNPQMDRTDYNEESVRPCNHNDWDDVRSRNGFKVLRCRVCQEKWRLASCDVSRCMAFLHDCCPLDVTCHLLHVRRRKTTIVERYEQFGESVLQNVSRAMQEQTRKHIALRQSGGSVGDRGWEGDICVRTSPTSPCSSCDAYTHSPYSWGTVTPPEFI
eukprot:TRINITY_DN11121_c0_g1_i2.p1 TRINITY_DN11121_c0_g1~~TRINITY_DN11121_c0_g1_i2.p1  ORF type:complete len:166 (+),score=20.64 TRINITY_DN11121_c0_g1_i2:122-619(+)